MVKSTFAFCAVGVAGDIDIDMLRRNQSSAQHAAKMVAGKDWSRLKADGWVIEEVEMRVRGMWLGVPPAAPSPPTAKANAKASSGYKPPERMSAAEYNASIVRMGGR
jgi:hypothetical protein